MSEDGQQPENEATRVSPKGQGHRPSAVLVNTWLEQDRRIREMLSPSVLRLLDEQQAWLKTISGAAAMPADFSKLFGARHLTFAGGVLADYERTLGVLRGFTPTLDAAHQLRALTSVGGFPALKEAMVAGDRLAQLMKPIDFPQVTLDLAGVSTALTSVASNLVSPALDAGFSVQAIASSALGSWRTYVDSLPSSLDVSQLSHVQAAARGALGVTASSAILLGDDEAVEIAEQWELAPADMRERMRDGLRQISPRLVARLDGAWDAVTHEGPDAVSQAANSAVEVIDWTLRLACDDAGLESWIARQVKPSIYRDDKGRATRQAKIRYLFQGRDFEAEFVAATARNINALRGELEKLKHSQGEHDVQAVARLLPSVEAVLILIVE